MSLDDLERLERERLDADRRYNDALTALDQAVIAAGTGRASVGVEDLRALGTRLMLFLQQITEFVDTKDRRASAATQAALAAHDRALEAVAELRTQVAVLQRASQMLKREIAGQQSAVNVGGPAVAGSGQPAAAAGHPPPATTLPRAAPSDSSLDDYKYVGFEDSFRGSDEEIGERLRAYLPLFAGTADVLDVGCGRGEFLALLRSEGIRARGVDTNHEMVAIARDRGLDVLESDALTYLQALPDQSLGGLIAAQVVEHLTPAYLMRLLDTAHHKLRPGAPIVIETINAACWLAFFSSYIRDLTHVRPIHPDTLQYLLQASGFTGVTIAYSAPVPAHMKMRPIDLSAEILTAADGPARALAETAHVINANAAILNNLLFTHLDFAAVGYCT